MLCGQEIAICLVFITDALQTRQCLYTVNPSAVETHSEPIPCTLWRAAWVWVDSCVPGEKRHH